MAWERTILAAVLVLPVWTASAAEPPRAAQQSQTLRSFVLRNRSDQPVTEAHAYTTAQRDIELTPKGPIQPLHAQEFMIEQTECVDRVAVKLQNGRTLQLDSMKDCRFPTIWVGNDGISIESSAAGLALPDAPRSDLPGNPAKENPPNAGGPTR